MEPFPPFIAAVVDRVRDLFQLGNQRGLVEPEFDFKGGVATWRRAHMHATIAPSPIPSPMGDHLLVLGRDPGAGLPLGHQSSQLPFFARASTEGTAARAIVDHFLAPA
jgi:hypothetical protein